MRCGYGSYGAVASWVYCHFPCRPRLPRSLRPLLWVASEGPVLSLVEDTRRARRLFGFVRKKTAHAGEMMGEKEPSALAAFLWESWVVVVVEVAMKYKLD